MMLYFIIAIARQDKRILANNQKLRGKWEVNFGCGPQVSMIDEEVIVLLISCQSRNLQGPCSSVSYSNYVTNISDVQGYHFLSNLHTQQNSSSLSVFLAAYFAVKLVFNDGNSESPT
jgi:hypothetical protein